MFVFDLIGTIVLGVMAVNDVARLLTPPPAAIVNPASISAPAPEAPKVPESVVAVASLSQEK